MTFKDLLDIHYNFLFVEGSFYVPNTSLTYKLIKAKLYDTSISFKINYGKNYEINFIDLPYENEHNDDFTILINYKIDDILVTTYQFENKNFKLPKYSQDSNFEQTIFYKLIPALISKFNQILEEKGE